MSVVNCTRCGAGVFTGERLTELPRANADTIDAIRAAARKHRERSFASHDDARIAAELDKVADTLQRMLGVWR
jgi:hypothetical protein